MILLQDILWPVSIRTGVKISDIRSKRRTDRICTARHIAMYLCYEATNEDYITIGKFLGRDHTTVIHGHKMIVERMAKYPWFKAMVDEIHQTVLGVIKAAAA